MTGSSLVSRHGPSGDHDRPGDRDADYHLKVFDILDIMEVMHQAAGDAFARWEPMLGHLACGWACTLQAIQLLALMMLLVAACKPVYSGRASLGRLCWLCMVLPKVEAVPTPPRRRVGTVPRATDLELWASGQLTMREQLARAMAEHILARPLGRSNGEAPPPDFHRPLDEEPPPLRVVPANAVHVTLWATTPYFEAEIRSFRTGPQKSCQPSPSWGMTMPASLSFRAGSDRRTSRCR